MIYALVLMFAIIPLYANNKEFFNAANEQYEQGDYAQALNTYQQICPKNASVWNNMANAAYNINDHLNADLYWSRAEKNSTRAMMKKITHNRSVAQLPFTQSFLHKIINFFTPLGIQILFFCLFSVFFIFVARYLAQKKYGVMCLFSLLCITSGMLTHYTYRHQKNRYGLIIADQTIAHIGPGTMYHTLGQICQGTRVLVDKEKDEWKKITWENNTGWIPSTQIEII
jgi:tetratricopeptide (TPR) repeat protein